MSQPGADPHILALADLNMLEGYRELARRAPGSRLHEADGMLLTIGPVPYWIIINTAFRVDRRVPAGLAVRRVADFYAGIGHGFCLFAPAHDDDDLGEAALAAGLEHAVDLPAMILTDPPKPVAPDSGTRVVEVRDAQATADYATIIAESFAPEVASLYADVASLVAPRIRGWVAYVEGVPAAGSSRLVSHGVGLIVTVGTRPAYQRRGLGDLVTRTAAIDAFGAGVGFVSLHSSPEAVPLYRRLGFEQISEYRLYGRRSPDR
jgi:ribosomal protein S18 acetylase RimI-like enzyme